MYTNILYLVLLLLGIIIVISLITLLIQWSPNKQQHMASTMAPQYAMETTSGPCSQPCGPGKQTREVTCVDVDGNVVDQSICNSDFRPATEQDCYLKDCEWEFSPWGDCMGGTQTRTVTCPREDELCAQTNPMSTLKLEQDCSKPWQYGEWSSCTPNCQQGVRTRTITCSDPDDTNCTGAPEPSEETCGHLQPCTWNTGEWQGVYGAIDEPPVFSVAIPSISENSYWKPIYDQYLMDRSGLVTQARFDQGNYPKASEIGMKDGLWYLKMNGVWNSACVGQGGHSSACDSSLNFCAGPNNTYGFGSDQIKAVFASYYKGGKHPLSSC